MNKQQLATKIWQSANEMRSKIEANEYKDYILGFIFYKYLSENEVRYAKSIGMTDADIKALKEDDKELVDHFKGNVGYFIDYSNLFQTWIEKKGDFDVSDVRDAISAFNRNINPTHKMLFENIFHTLDTGLSKLGDTSGAQTKSIRNLLDLIKDIPMDGRQDYDVLGYIYEYLISMFAANAGKKAGEFYTPHEVSLLMSDIVAHHLKDKTEISIYDPTSGSGSLLINIGKSVSKHIEGKNKIKYFAQELKENTYNLTRMNLIMRGILVDNIVTRNADTLEDDWPYFDESDPANSYEPLYVDAVVSNPPYSQQWDPTDKEADQRYAQFGLAPKSKADYAFLLHDLYHVKPDGIMTIVLPHGVLFRGGEEGKIRKNLIELNHIDAIIGLPANIFFGTGIPTIVMVLKQKRADNNVIIVDASKGFVKVGKNNQLRSSDIKRIVDCVTQRRELPKFSKLVSLDEIRQNEYNLNIPRYVDASDENESWDIYASMFGGIPKNELQGLDKYWKAFPNLKTHLFNEDEKTATIKVKELRESIINHNDVVEFTNNFKKSFDDLPKLLYKKLIDDIDFINITKEEDELGNDILKRLKSMPLVDKYSAYQIFKDEWTQTAIDLEIIQSDGKEAIKTVDPNLVTKKTQNKEVEVQEGWRGKIIPFELVQTTLLAQEYDAIKEKEQKLSEINARFSELFESLTEEEKEEDVVNEAKDAFVNSEVTKLAKTLQQEMKKGDTFEDDSFEMKIVEASNIIEETRKLNREIKSDNDKLHIKTKETIEQLSDEDSLKLLEKKWIDPIIVALHQMPNEIVNQLTAKVEALAEKYNSTYQEVVTKITESEKKLSQMIEQLTGSDYDMDGLAQLTNLLKGE